MKIRKLKIENLVRRIRLKTWVGLGLILILLPLIIFGVVYKDSLLAALGGSDANPAAHWAFDEGSANTCSGGANDACDNSGSGNDGAFGATTAAPTIRAEDLCVSGKCLFFDGSNDTVTVANTVASVQSVTFWVKVMSTSTTEQILDLNGTDTFSSVSGTLTVAGFGTDTVYIDSKVATTLTANRWHHVAVTSTTGFSASAITMGNISTNFGNLFMDELKLFTAQLSSDQVKAEYAGGAAVFADKNAFLNDGLVGYWAMDESTANSCTGGSEDNCDKSGNTNHGVWTGDATNGAGKYGNAVALAGTDDYVNVGDPASGVLDFGTASFTFSAWMKANSVANNPRIINKGFNGASDGYRMQLISTGVVAIGVGAGGTLANSLSFASTTTVNDSAWHHLVAVIDNNEKRAYIYIDGVASAITEDGCGTAGSNYLDFTGCTSWTSSSTTSLNIGSLVTAEELNGSIDEVRIYGIALSPANTKSLYNWAPGPVGYWKMDEGSWTNDCSTDSVFDSSGYGNNGDACPNATGPTGAASGKFGKGGGTFDGTEDQIDAGSAASLDITQTITIALWVRPTSLGTRNDIISKNQNYWFNLQNTGKLNVYLDSISPSPGYYESTSAISTNTWSHIAFTYDGSEIKQYINGQLDKTHTGLSGAFSTSTLNNLLIGYWSSTNGYVGSMDDLRIYNYARTPQQIVEDMNGGHPAGGSPIGSQVAYWAMDEQYGTTINNTAPTTFTTSISGATWRTKENCKVNGCLDFDGTDDVTTVTNADAIDLDVGLANGFSASTWFYADSDGEADTGQIFQKGTSTYCRTDNETGGSVDIECNLDLATTDATVNVSSAATTGSWNHLVMTYDDLSTIKVYINGIERGSNTGSGATSADTANLLLGGTTTANFDGKIDEFQVYSSELTAEQIKVIRNTGGVLSFGTTTNEATQDTGAGNPPIGYWNFDERVSTTANDTSGNGNTATLESGVTWVQGKYGSAAMANAVTDDITTSSTSFFDLGDTEDLTIEAWLNPDNLGPTNMALIATSGCSFGAGDIGFRLISLSDQSVTLEVADGVDEYSIDSGTVNDDVWTHITVVFDQDSDSGSTIYVNGIQSEGSTTGTIADIGAVNGGALFFGCDSNGYIGALDDIKIYDYARSAAQIAYDYNRGGPVGWWQFDENVSGNGQTLNDNSGLALNATTDDGANNTGMDCTVAAKFNLGCDFDGTDDFVSVTTPSTLQITGDVSISLWVNADTIADAEGLFAIRASGETEAANQLYGLDWDTTSGNDLFYEHEYSAGSNEDSIIDANLSTDTWYHLTIVRNVTANTVVLYVNGVQSGSTFTYTNDPTGGSTGSLFIGSTDGTQEYFDGTIDDVRIFNYALSVSQVRKLYNNNAGAKFGPSQGTP